MECNQLHEQLDDFLDKALSKPEQQAVEAHLEVCKTCQAVIAEEQALRDMLRQLPSPRLSSGFVERALRVAAERNAHRHHRAGFVKGFGAALAAGVALWIVVGVLPVSRQLPTPAAHEISVALYETQNVKLAFHAVNALQDAKITIQLPENIALAGYDGRRELVWHTSLKQGDNILTLPVRAQAIAKGFIHATVEHGHQTKTIDIAINVKQNGISMEPSQSNSV